MHHPLSDWEKSNLTQLRVFEGLREMGVLLMTFTPLDGALGEEAFQEAWPTLVALFCAGFAVFWLGVFGERRLHGAG